MSKPIFSPAAAGALADSIPPAWARQFPGRELEPGLRIVEGRVFYSAAWLDQSTRRLRPSDAEARSAGRTRGGLGG